MALTLPILPFVSSTAIKMSELSKENLSQAEKLAQWRKKRGDRLRMDGKPSTERRRPVLRPLPNRKTSDITTPLVTSKNLTVQSSVGKPTPFSNQSATTSSDSSRNSGFMLPTAASSRRSIGNLSGRPLTAQMDHSRLSSSLHRKSHGALSKPPMRAQRGSSISSSFLQLSDGTQLFSEPAECSEDDTLKVSMIHLTSPCLPDTSPLPFGSPTYIRLSSNKKKGEIGESIATINPKRVQLSNAVDAEAAEQKQPQVHSIDRTDSNQTEDVGRKQSGSFADNECPALNAALHEFSNINLSFDLDFSSEEEGSNHSPAHQKARLDRCRSRGLGPLLPIPSLRNDLESAPTTSGDSSAEILQEDQSPTLILDKQSNSTKVTGNNSELVNHATEDIIVESPDLMAPERTKTFELLLPIPSLRDDSPINVAKMRRRKSIYLTKRSPSSSDSDSANSLPLSRQRRNSPKHSDDIRNDDEKGLTPTTCRTTLQRDLPNALLRSMPSKAPECSIAPDEITLTPFQQNTTNVGDEASTSSLLDVAPRNNFEQKLSFEIIERTTGDDLASKWVDAMPLVKLKDRHILTAVPEETTSDTTVQILQNQLEEVLKENKELSDRLARYHRSYEDRVTPYRDLFEEWKKSKQQWKATEAAHQQLVQEVQDKFSQALQLSLQKCQDLQAQLQASHSRIRELEAHKPTS